MKSVAEIMDGCVNCNVCVKECEFLLRHGTPGAICAGYEAGDLHQSTVFACNLCGLCKAVCPKDLDVPGAFLAIRRDIQQGGRESGATVSVHQQHRRICGYERLGGSPLLSLLHLPPGCDTVFFPGCTFAATRSAVTLKTYAHLRTVYANCGIVLDCCAKPSHDLGLAGTFQQSFSRLAAKLKDGGVKRIFTACPSCFVTFREYLPECRTSTVYEELAANPPPLAGKCTEIVTVHDTCTTRHVPEIHDAVRVLVKATGAVLQEVPHCRGRAICCGEGAAAVFIAPEITGRWKTIRRDEADGNRVITYCAGCSSTLGEDLRATHLLDLVFDHERAIDGQEQKTRSPFTYFNRLLLKWRIHSGVKSF